MVHFIYRAGYSGTLNEDEKKQHTNIEYVILLTHYKMF